MTALSRKAARRPNAMRTVRGVPERSLLSGRRFTALVTYSCEDESEPRVERTFVDIAPGRLEILLRIDEAFTAVFPIQITARRNLFPRFRAWLAMIRGAPFSVPRDDVAIRETCISVRVRGYFDARFDIRFDVTLIAEAIARFALPNESHSSAMEANIG